MLVDLVIRFVDNRLRYCNENTNEIVLPDSVKRFWSFHDKLRKVFLPDHLQIFEAGKRYNSKQ